MYTHFNILLVISITQMYAIVVFNSLIELFGKSTNLVCNTRCGQKHGKGNFWIQQNLGVSHSSLEVREYMQIILGSTTR